MYLIPKKYISIGTRGCQKFPLDSEVGFRLQSSAILALQEGKYYFIPLINQFLHMYV